MRDFITDVRADYASMTATDWAQWALFMVITLAGLAYVLTS